MGDQASRRGEYALGLSVSEGFLNALASAAIGDGIEMGETRQTFSLPIIGDVEISVKLTVTGVSFTMTDEHPDKLLATIRAAGELVVHGEVPMAAFPGPVHVRGDVLVRPVVEYGRRHSLFAVLDVAESELVGASLERIDGLEADAEAQLQMSQMLFAAVGGDLFLGLAEELGHVGLDRRAGEVPQLAHMGVVPGHAEIDVTDGCMWVGFRGDETLDGTAGRVHVEPGELGVSIASAGLSTAVAQASRFALGMDAPVDHRVSSRSGSLSGHLRNTRLVESVIIPDLRPGLRYSVEPRLVDESIELKLSEAWVDVPIVGSFLNGVSRFIGGAVAVAPLTQTLPAVFGLPTGRDADSTIAARVVMLDTSDAGVDAVLDVNIVR